VNYRGRGIKVVLDMTTVGTGSVTLTIKGKDTASGKYYTLLAGAAVTTNSTNVYTVFPGATASANVSANDMLPRTWQVVVTANNANATTYTVGASVIV
jgi:predicted secreted protein